MAQFSKYLPLLQQVEGGYQKLSKDTGNYNSQGQLVGTNYGISAPIYENWIQRVPSELDMRNMLKGTAIIIYQKWFWNAMKADYMQNQTIANILVDHAVNAGVGRAARLIQEVLNTSFKFNLIVDGKIGTKTLQVINQVNQEQLHEAIKAARTEYYKSIGGEFLKGWLNRLRFFFTKKKR